MKFIIDKKIKSTIPSTKLFDLGTDAEIGINNLLDLSTIYIDQNIIPILKINDSNYLINDWNSKNIKESVELLLTEDDLIPLSGSGSGGDFVPLTGTEVGSPVSGNIEIIDGVSIIPEPLGGAYYLGDIYKTALGITVDGITVASTSPLLSRGLTSEVDFTPNITDLDYTQKKYVDEAILSHIPSSAVPTLQEVVTEQAGEQINDNIRSGVGTFGDPDYTFSEINKYGLLSFRTGLNADPSANYNIVFASDDVNVNGAFQNYIGPIGGAICQLRNGSLSSTVPTPTSFGYKGEVRIIGAFRYDCIATDFGALTGTWVRTPVTTIW